MDDEDLPAPLVPPDCDVSKLSGFMLDTVRLLNSELWVLSTGEEFKAAVTLWCRAWQQTPPASLPNDDRVLAGFAGYARDLKAWQKIRDMALRGFVLCSDGRLYHPALAADALRASKARQQRRDAISRRWSRRHESDTDEHTAVSTTEQDAADTVVIPGTGQGRDENKKQERNTVYAFAGRAIRLTAADLDRWRRSYAHIPDIIAELQAADDYYAEKPPTKGKLFHSVSSWLRRANEQAMQRKKEAGRGEEWW